MDEGFANGPCPSKMRTATALRITARPTQVAGRFDGGPGWAESAPSGGADPGRLDVPLYIVSSTNTTGQFTVATPAPRMVA